jgi:hypothetical protein
MAQSSMRLSSAGGQGGVRKRLPQLQAKRSKIRWILGNRCTCRHQEAPKLAANLSKRRLAMQHWRKSMTRCTAQTQRRLQWAHSCGRTLRRRRALRLCMAGRRAGLSLPSPSVRRRPLHPRAGLHMSSLATEASSRMQRQPGVAVLCAHRLRHQQPGLQRLRCLQHRRLQLCGLA